VVTGGHTEPARLPPPGIEGLDPSWSRLVRVPLTDGIGRTWHVLDNGVAEPRLTLLCVHGNPSWSYLFRGLVAAAPPGVRVIAVDQLEMGWSERTGRVRRLARRIDDLCELTDELGLAGPVVTVAHDWGGPISLGWAERHLEQLTGVVLMNTAVHQPEGSPAPSLIRIARSKPMLRNVSVRTTTFVRGAFGMSRPRPPSGVRRGYLAPYATAGRREAIGGFVADIPLAPSHPSWPALTAVAAGLRSLAAVPVLLVWGARDLVFSDLYLHDLERRLPHAEVHRFPRAAHFVMEDADAVGVIVDWVGTLDGRRPAPTAASPADANVTASTLGDVHAELGDRAAIVEMTEGRPTVTFAELDALVSTTAAGLVASGVQPGDRVALMIPPGIDLAAVLYACWRAGAVVVLVDSGLGPRGMSAAMRVADPAFLVGIPKAVAAARALRWPGRRISTSELPALRRRHAGLPAQPRVDDPAAVVFTSGATGPSKGVRYSHAQLAAQRDALVRLYGITPDDRLVAAFAPFALYGPAMGITSVVPDMDVAAPATLAADALGDAVAAIDATMVFASPAALRNVVATADRVDAGHRAAFAGVRTLMSAGAPVRPSLLRAARDLFPHSTAHTPYGMTECLPVASIELAEIEELAGRPGAGDGVCVGRPAHGVAVVVRRLDQCGRSSGEPTTAPGVVGEVLVRAAHMRTGYERLWRTEHLASQPAGWHATGDVGHLDDDGRLWIGGRLGHVITTADGPVAPVRLELAIEAIDGVDAAAVVGIGPVGGQQVVAVVQPSDPPRRAREAGLALLDRVRDAVGRDVVAVLVVPGLPVDRRHNSKIDRTRLAAWAERVLAGGRLTRP
jgi:acyl-coenzyme A synthetase/AMP-(fatty) acid ligase/pimeloyl-ACP methyl ester carboxylesterase